MRYLAVLIPVALIIGMIYVFYLSIKGAFEIQKDADKIAWVLLIVLLFPLGSILFFIINPNKKK